MAIVPTVILASGLLFAAAGVVILLAVDPLIGAIFIAVGLVDAVVAAVALAGRRAGAERARRAAIEGDDAGGAGEPDPSHNPYARED